MKINITATVMGTNGTQYGNFENTRIFVIEAKSGQWKDMGSMIEQQKGIKRVSDLGDIQEHGIVVFAKDENGKEKILVYTFDDYGRAIDGDRNFASWLQKNKIPYRLGNRNF